MKTLITKSIFLCALFLALPIEVVKAQSGIFPSAEEDFLKPKNMDVTLGWSQTNLSITNGVLLQTQLLPTFNFNAENAKGFLSIQNGAGLWLFRDEDVKVGASVNYMLGRYAKFDPKYAPLGDVSGSFDAYLWAEWQPIKEAVTAYANYARTVDASYRAYGQLGVTLGLPLIGPFNAFADLNLNYANQTYLQKYYGVDARQSMASARSTFLPTQAGLINGAGLMGLDMVVSKDSDLILGAGQLKYAKNVSVSPLNAQAQQKTLLLVWNQKLKP